MQQINYQKREKDIDLCKIVFYNEFKKSHKCELLERRIYG